MLDEEKQRVIDNLPLVTYILKKNGVYPSLNKRWIREYEDLLQQGYLGLCVASMRFDESKGFRFATFATFYIDGYIKRYKRECDTRLRLHRDSYDSMQKAYRLADKYNMTIDSIQDLVVLRDISGVDFDVDKAYEGMLPVDSLNRTASEEAASNSHTVTELEDLIAYIDDNFDYTEYIDLVNSIIQYVKSRLSEKSGNIFEEYINDLVYSGYMNTQQDIAAKYNVSQSYASRILNQGRDLCKRYLISNGYFREEDFNGRKRTHGRNKNKRGN